MPIEDCAYVTLESEDTINSFVSHDSPVSIDSPISSDLHVSYDSPAVLKSLQCFKAGKTFFGLLIVL